MYKNLPHMFIIYTNDNGELKEKVYFKTYIPDDLLVESDIIIDILNSKIEKNRFHIKNEDKFIEEYMSKYSDQITEIVKIYFSKNKDIWEKFKNNAEKVANSLDQNL